MSENLHDIDKLFKNAIEQHEEEPSAQVWDAIDKNLDKKKVVSISRKYNKLKWAVAILLFIFYRYGYVYNKNREMEQRTCKEKIILKRLPKKIMKLNRKMKRIPIMLMKIITR